MKEEYTKRTKKYTEGRMKIKRRIHRRKRKCNRKIHQKEEKRLRNTPKEEDQADKKREEEK